MTSRARGLRALLLTGLFAAGTLGLPLTDAALFHLGTRDPYAGVVHVETQGSLHHADRCTLGAPTAPGLQAAASAAATLRLQLPECGPIRPAAVALRSKATSPLPPARAPPLTA